MNPKIILSIKFFLIFFCFGLGGYLLFYSFTEQSKPMVNESDHLAVNGTVSDVAQLVSPSIVGITNVRDDGDLFSLRTSESTGSGVILDKEGHIVTNHHVVRDAQRLIVTLADGNEKEAKIIGMDPRTDLAVIKIDVKNKVTPAEFGDSEELVVGQQVVAIGNPLGLRFARSVTAGVVSGLNRLITTEEGFVFRLIQTDAAINPGNSGGALVNLDGQVIGINSIKIAVQGFEGMGFSIPSRQVQMVVKELIKNGRVERPILGIQIMGEVSKDEAKYFNLPIYNGVAISPIPGGPAAKAGLREYDIITEINGEKIETSLQLQETIMAHEVGETLKIKYARMPRIQGKTMEQKTINIKLEQE
ncbi:MAG: trypsin-like peptidase domain-containing protein [Bacillota bacterium]|nr:trypsin-like peptidase domain-containing protein [Bacillota bacterium]